MDSWLLQENDWLRGRVIKLTNELDAARHFGCTLDEYSEALEECSRLAIENEALRRMLGVSNNEVESDSYTV